MDLEQFIETILRHGVPFSVAKSISTGDIDFWFDMKQYDTVTSYGELSLDDVTEEEIEAAAIKCGYKITRSTDIIDRVECYIATYECVQTKDLAKN